MDNKILHRNYWIGILSAIIICLLVFKYTPDVALKEYVSFAATIASLILAILAILQAMYSNSNSDVTMLSLTKSSNSIEEKTKILNDVVSELQQTILNLPKEVGEQVRSVLPESSITETSDIKQKVNENNTKEYYKNYVMLGSVNGLLLLYAINLSIKKQKGFTLNDLLPENLRAANIENMSGYLTSHYAAGFVTLANHNGDLLSFKDTAITEDIVNEAIVSFLQNNKNQVLITYFLTVRNNIDSFFNS